MIIAGKTAEWEVVIGLEVHAQISTRYKLFSMGACSFGDEPNSSVNIFDAAMPGTLPVLNYSCVEKAVRAGIALSGRVNLLSRFDRKHYFYPDLPSGYQITQQQSPIITGGSVTIELKDNREKDVRIHHIHIEQDAGKSLHDLIPNKTCIDLNRAGVPLMEIVSEPDMRSSDEAAKYVSNLQLILQYVGSSNANMDKGELRCDANVSVRRVGDAEFGTRCEIKNLNSLKSLIQAIEYEAVRQVELIEGGASVCQQTRLFDTDKRETRSMRGKENADDYRYFPDPDLPPLELSEDYIRVVKESLPELPREKRIRYLGLGMTGYDSDVIIVDIACSRYFDHVIDMGRNPKLAARWLTTELFGILNKDAVKFCDCGIDAGSFAEFLKFIEDGVISQKIAKDVLAEMFESNRSAKEIIEESGLVQIVDKSELMAHVVSVLNTNKDKVSEYLGGKDKLYGFFVGQVMKLTKGMASPSVVNDILKAELHSMNEK